MDQEKRNNHWDEFYERFDTGRIHLINCVLDALSWILCVIKGIKAAPNSKQTFPTLALGRQSHRFVQASADLQKTECCLFTVWPQFKHLVDRGTLSSGRDNGTTMWHPIFSNIASQEWKKMNECWSTLRRKP